MTKDAETPATKPRAVLSGHSVETILVHLWTNRCYSRNKEPFIRQRIKVQISSSLEISVRRLSGLLTNVSPVSLRWFCLVRKDSPVLLY